MASTPKTASGKILHNSFWYGIEVVLEAIIFIGTSVAVARYLGPDKMGYFVYINLFVSTVTRTSGTGLSSATRKYMAEFLALDRPGTARAVYHLAHRYQLLAAILITVVGLASVLLFGDPQYRAMSCVLILAVLPGMMSWVPAQANNAFEDAYPNTISAFGYLLSYALVIFLTLVFHWDLVGIASATLVGRTFEVIMRTIPVNAKLRKMPLDAIPPDVVARIRRYCIQAMGLQLLMSVVWDRSEVFFLRRFSNLDQIAYYGISIGLADKLLLIPRTFGQATGYTLMVESHRKGGQVDSIVRTACRYLLLVALPVNLGAAAIATGVLAFAYGSRYAGAAPVMMIAAGLGTLRAFQEMPDVLLRAADRQKQLLIALSIAGVVNLALDWFLIRPFGAIGAAWANGLAQGIGIAAMWVLARRTYNFHLPWLDGLRLCIAGFTMAAVAYFLSHAVHGLPGVVLAVAAAIPTYVLMIKVVRGLQSGDRQRLAPIGNRFPGAARRAYLATIAFITPAEA